MTRVALITGAAQGIGAACAEGLLKSGFSGVLLVDRNIESLAATAARLSAFGRVNTLHLDLRDGAAPRMAIAAVLKLFGQVDVLINAAGNTARGGVGDVLPETFNALFDVNVKAPLFLMQEAARAMGKAKRGTIINIASMIAYGGPPNLGVYSASKAALVALTKHAAQEFAWDGIRCFCVNLGWALTEGEHTMQTQFHGLPEDWAEEIGSQMPSGRLILPSDIAALVNYLVSPSAQMMNGAVIDFEQIPVGMFRSHPVLKSS